MYEVAQWTQWIDIIEMEKIRSQQVEILEEASRGNSRKQRFKLIARGTRDTTRSWKSRATKFRTLLPSIPFLLIDDKIFRSTLRWSRQGKLFKSPWLLARYQGGTNVTVVSRNPKQDTVLSSNINIAADNFCYSYRRFAILSWSSLPVLRVL